MIHIFKEQNGFEVWTDCEPGEYHTGRCIGIGDTKGEAMADAVRELERDMDQLIEGRAASISC